MMLRQTLPQLNWQDSATHSDVSSPTLLYLIVAKAPRGNEARRRADYDGLKHLCAKDVLFAFAEEGALAGEKG